MRHEKLVATLGGIKAQKIGRCIKMIMRLVVVILSIVAVNPHLIAADINKKMPPSSSPVPQGGFRRVDKNHPLYIQLKRYYSHQELDAYREKVDTFLATLKGQGKVSDAVGEGLQYANYIENHKIKNILTETIHKYSPLIKIKVATTILENDNDTINHSWFMYFPKEDALEKATGAIIYTLRNLIDKGGVIHESFYSIKSLARLSVFFMNTAGDETGFSILMNGNSQSFAQTLETNVLDNRPAGSSSSSHLSSDIHSADANLMIAIKKEKGIERIIFFDQGLTRALRKLQELIGRDYELGEGAAAISAVWGKNAWVLQNYVEAQFNRQKQASDRFMASAKQENRVNPIYLHTDGFYYVDIGLKSILQDSRVVLKLSPLDTEFQFQFMGWATVSPGGTLGELLEILPWPQWDIPTLDDKLATSSFVYDAQNMYYSHSSRFSTVISHLQDRQYIDWLNEQIEIQVKAVLADKTHLEVSWYASNNNYTFYLPLYYKGRLILVAAFELDKTSPAMKFVMRSVLLPIWAYNNARILGIPKSSWMKRYAADLTPQEESAQWAQHRAEKVSEEAH